MCVLPRARATCFLTFIQTYLAGESFAGQWIPYYGTFVAQETRFTCLLCSLHRSHSRRHFKLNTEYTTKGGCHWKWMDGSQDPIPCLHRVCRKNWVNRRKLQGTAHISVHPEFKSNVFSSLLQGWKKVKEETDSCVAHLAELKTNPMVIEGCTMVLRSIMDVRSRVYVIRFSLYSELPFENISGVQC